LLQQRAIGRIDAFVEAYRKTGDTRSRLAELAQAERELAASNQAFAARGDWDALAFGLIKEGHIPRMQGNWVQALALYHQAVDAARRAKNVVHESDALCWGALAEVSRKNLGQAMADATQAVRLAESTADKDLLARCLDIVGTAQLAQGDLAGAAATLDREVAVAAQAKDPMATYFAVLNRSDVYLKIGEKCDFKRDFEPCNQALDKAVADLQKAAAIARGQGFPALALQTEQFIKTAETRRALMQSQERMDQALQKYNIFHPKRPGDVLVTERFVAPAGPIPPALEQMVQASRRMGQQAGGFADVTEARSQYVEGLMNEMQGNQDAALDHYLKAVATLERDRRALRDDRSRGTFLEDRIGIYYAPVQQLLERRRYAEAFELLERSRSRAMADMLASRKVALARPEEQKLYADNVLLRTRIASAQSELFELVATPDASKHGQRIAAQQNQIRALESEQQQLSARIATEAPRLLELVVSEPVTLKALQQSMREERYELLQYLVLEHGVILWHISPDSVFVRHVFLPRSEVMSKVAALQKSLNDPRAAFDETTSRELFLYLIQPAVARIRSERLVVIPHEDLGYIPFQVLQDPSDGRFLGERLQISYAPSASVLLGMRRSTGISGGRLLAVADPGIVAAGPEVGAIERFFPGRSKVVTAELAREADVKAWVRDFDVIHLSVHGKFDASEPLLSHLNLGRGGGDDGKLTAAEMFGLPLDNSRLVVLSACETGRAESTHGNEIVGMVRALIYAGAGTLVLSYWEVDSAATALWMQTFYETAQSRPLAEAARTALVRVKSRPEYRHPYYWAAFTMIGRQ
jgi:CHAT domain-containing protein